MNLATLLPIQQKLVGSYFLGDEHLGWSRCIMVFELKIDLPNGGGGVVELLKEWEKLDPPLLPLITFS